MKILGYCTEGKKQYVAFAEKGDGLNCFKITDGFHDKVVKRENVERYNSFSWTDKEDIDLKRIERRMRGTRPWHPLLRLLKDEAIASVD